MSSSGSRAQVEPLPALLALAVFMASLGVFATTLHAVQFDDRPAVDRATVRRVLETLREGTVVRPSRLSRVATTSPDGGHVAVVVLARDRRWRVGPTPPDSARTSSRSVLVASGSGAVRGRLRVSTWS